MTLTRELVYGRNAARELYRGPRQVLETWVVGKKVWARPSAGGSAERGK